MKRLFLAVLAALLAALVPAPADAKPAKRKAEIVCFKKTVETKSGRKVRKKVCRPRRAKKPTVRQAPAATPPVAPAIPKTGEGPGPSTVLGMPAPSSPPPPAAAPACVPEDSDWLAATAMDVNARFTLRLSRTCLRAGRTLVRYQNEDLQDHDLWIEGTAPAVTKREVVAPVAPESVQDGEMTLTAGEWRLFCSIPGHGTMSRPVTVVP